MLVHSTHTCIKMKPEQEQAQEQLGTRLPLGCNGDIRGGNEVCCGGGGAPHRDCQNSTARRAVRKYLHIRSRSRTPGNHMGRRDSRVQHTDNQEKVPAPLAAKRKPDRPAKGKH